MTEVLESLILGIVQGLTEFLPVSSSGHLEITKYLLGDESLAEESLAMTVALHVATALSTILVFRKDIAELLRTVSLSSDKGSMPYFLKIAITMVPAGFIGLFFEDQMAALFDGQLLLVGLMLLITATMLFAADTIKTNYRPVSYKDSIIIGLAQALALLPGISRSGSTICTAVILKIDREEAARFSFLIVLPLILGKGV
jgi:undecaprenyl-diphosphatase